MAQSTLDNLTATYGVNSVRAPSATKARVRSEPASQDAWHSVLYGRHMSQPHEEHPKVLKTIAAAAMIMTPDEVYQHNAENALHKHEYPFPKLLVLGILAGAYIALGFALCSLVGGLLSPDFRLAQPGVFNFLFGIFGFPMGLTLCVVAGADLFTSNCMYTIIGVSEGKYGLLGAFRTMIISYFCNLLGALLIIGLMNGGGVFAGRGDFVVQLALAKTSHTFAQELTKAS